MTEISKLIFDKQKKDKEKADKETQERLDGYSKKLLEWLSNEGLTVRDTSAILRALLTGIDATMQAKARPVVDEWSAKTFKDFYASTNTTEGIATTT